MQEATRATWKTRSRFTATPWWPPKRSSPHRLRRECTLYTRYMDLPVSELSHPELYNILISSVAPRPIAWVSSLSAEGRPNLAPFSFFNCVCAEPPLLAFAPGLRSPKEPAGIDAEQGTAKDTLRN